MAALPVLSLYVVTYNIATRTATRPAGSYTVWIQCGYYGGSHCYYYG